MLIRAIVKPNQSVATQGTVRLHKNMIVSPALQTQRRCCRPENIKRSLVLKAYFPKKQLFIKIIYYSGNDMDDLRSAQLQTPCLLV